VGSEQAEFFMSASQKTKESNSARSSKDCPLLSAQRSLFFALLFFRRRFDDEHRATRVPHDGFGG
jgi:hypothetical protein